MQAIARFREAWPLHAEERRQSGSIIDQPMVGMVRGMFIADTDAEAERIARPAYRKWFDSLMWLWRENNSFPGIPLSQDFDESIRDGSLVVGSPDTVRRTQVRRAGERCGHDYLVLKLAFGSLHPRAGDALARAVPARGDAGAAGGVRLTVGEDRSGCLTRAAPGTGSMASVGRGSADPGPPARKDAMTKLNETHDPRRTSWVESANRPDTGLPDSEPAVRRISPPRWRTAWRRRHRRPHLRSAGRSGRRTVLRHSCRSGKSRGGTQAQSADGARQRSRVGATGPTLGSAAHRWSPERQHVVEALQTECSFRWRPCRLELPGEIASYTDFFTSIYHAERGGRHAQSQTAADANFKHIPIGYNGRATSIRPSGERFQASDRANIATRTASCASAPNHGRISSSRSAHSSRAAIRSARRSRWRRRATISSAIAC